MTAESLNGRTIFDPENTAETRRSSARLDRLKRIHAERNGLDPPPATLTPHQQRVLDAAHRIAAPGDPISPSAIAKVMGIKPIRVSVAITVLRGLDLWPFAPARGAGRPSAARADAGPDEDEAKPAPTPTPPRRAPARADGQADAELAAIGRALELIGALPPDAARRVMAYLGARFGDGGA